MTQLLKILGQKYLYFSYPTHNPSLKKHMTILLEDKIVIGLVWGL